MTNHDVVKKLIGNITPAGCSATDEQRFENLKAMTELVERLLVDIDDVAFQYSESHEHSVKRSGEYASKFIDNILK